MNGHLSPWQVGFAFGVDGIKAGYLSLRVGTAGVTTPLAFPLVLLSS